MTSALKITGAILRKNESNNLKTRNLSRSQNKACLCKLATGWFILTIALVKVEMLWEMIFFFFVFLLLFFLYFGKLGPFLLLATWWSIMISYHVTMRRSKSYQNSEIMQRNLKNWSIIFANFCLISNVSFH